MRLNDFYRDFVIFICYFEVSTCECTICTGEFVIFICEFSIFMDLFVNLKFAYAIFR